MLQSWTQDHSALQSGNVLDDLEDQADTSEAQRAGVVGSMLSKAILRALGPF